MEVRLRSKALRSAQHQFTHNDQKTQNCFDFGYGVFLVCLLEGTARLAFMIPQIASLRANEDYTNRRQWVRRHQESGEVYYSFDIYDPSTGWRPKANLRDVTVFGNKILNTNSRGLRGKKDVPYIEDKTRLRILILGDSFTFGDGVSDAETYSYFCNKCCLILKSSIWV